MSDAPDTPDLPDTPLADAARVVDQMGAVLVSPQIHAALTEVCAAVNRLFDAESTSIAVLAADGSGLLYVAAQGTAADRILGTQLPLSSGIAGFVASSGQSLVVCDVRLDPRFASDIAERVGYTPTTLMAVPVADDRSVLGVLSVLDPRRVGTAGSGESLDLAAAMARIAAPLIAAEQAADSIARVVFDGLGRVAGDDELGDALAAATAESAGGSHGLAEMAALFADLGRLSTADRAAATRIVAAFVDHATAQRRGRPRR